MKKFLILVVVIMLSACTSQTPQSEVKKTITEMIKLIDQGKSKELLANYADLSDIKGTVTDIPENKLKRLRIYLVRAKELQPELTESNTLAVFKDPTFKRPLRFKKINGKWLLKNK